MLHSKVHIVHTLICFQLTEGVYYFEQFEDPCRTRMLGFDITMIREQWNDAVLL